MKECNASKRGIICKLWDIKNNKGANGKVDLNASIVYIEDEEKTTLSVEDLDANLKNSINYATDDLKTMHKALVGAYLINDIDNAAQEMTDIKTIYGKTDGRIALHGVISLIETESSIENAGKLISMARDVLTELFPNHQFVYAVHTNTENLHIHFIVNSVGIDGRKIHRDNHFIKDVLQPTVNDKAIKYGFTPNSRWIEKREADSLSFADRKILLRRDIDEAIEKSDDFDMFCKLLQDEGYTVNVGKHISLQNQYMERAIRTKQLGKNYTSEEIVQRIVNRLEAFNYLEASNHTQSCELDKSYFKIAHMPKYKDMTDKQKREVIALLKDGRNPWQEHFVRAWQFQRLNRQIKIQANAHTVIRAYSSTANTAVAIEEIISRQKGISQEKKSIRANLKKYKPIIDLYKNLQKYQVKAYLYEFCGSTEYANEYALYMELVNRLQEGYDKSPEDVYQFIADQQNQLLYLQAQSKELSEEYMAIKRYVTSDIYRARQVGMKLNLKEIANYYDDVVRADKTGIVIADTKYIASKESEYIIRMTKSVYINHDGKPKQDVEFVVLDMNGVIMQKLSLKEEGNLHDFNENVASLQLEYDFTDCYMFSSVQEAKSIAKENGDNKPDKAVKHFMKAVNALSKDNKEGIHYFANRDGSGLIAKVVTTLDSIKIYAIDKNNEEVAMVEAPNLEDRNEEGFFKLIQFKEKCGFQSDLIIEENIENIENKTVKTIEEEQRVTRKVR